jgi:VanZ family protein
MAAIFAAQMWPHVPPPPQGLTDKHEHLFGYALLGVLALRSFATGRWKAVRAGTSIAAVVFASGYGVMLEFCQRLVPERSFEMSDMRADAIGAAAGVGAVYAWSIIRRRSETPDVL